MIIKAVVIAVLGCVASVAVAKVDARPQLAYLAVTEGYWEVWTARADGKHARQLTRSKNDKTRLSWYPDGTALLVSCNDGQLMKVDLQGQETSLSLAQHPVVDAVLSPNGRHIAFSFSSARDGNDIWIANHDGSAAEKVARMSTLQHEPVWSADSKRLYFLSGDGGQAHDIWRLSLEDRNAEQLTVGALYHFDVAVSASGTLAFSSNRTGNYEIYLQRSGAPPEQLTDDPALDGRPAFAPDETALIFESSRGGVLNLWRIDVASRNTRQITHHKKGARAPAWYQGTNK